MIIENFHITNFCSILDSGVLKTDKQLNTFIGANESGKTSIFRALKNMDTDFEEDDFCTFSDSWEKWQSKEIEKADIKMLDIRFTLDDYDKQNFTKIHKGLFTDTIDVIKYFSGEYEIGIDGIDLNEISSDIKEKNIKKNINGVRKELQELKKLFHENDEMLMKLTNIIRDTSIVLEKSPDNIDTIINNQFDKIRQLSYNDISSKSINSILSLTQPYLASIKKLNADGYDVFYDLIELLPSFEYLGDYEELKNSYNFNSFISNREDFTTLNKLMKLVQWEENTYKSRDSTGKKLLLARASKKFEKMFNEFWGQDYISFEIHIDDEVSILITDKLVEMPQKLSMRSEGLNGAISLFIHLMSIPENTIILLDDPGVHLHPSAQKDILKLMKRMSKEKQIFFSTHSPSMIDRNNLKSVNLVVKDQYKGTNINVKFYKSDYDIFEPIRTAIGMTLADSLFTTNRNLLVEGISDLFIIEAMSKFVSNSDKEAIDTSKISIFPTNGAKKMSIYVPLIIKENQEFVCVFDFDKEGKESKKELIDKFDVKEKNIIILNDLFDEDINKDIAIEDLIDFDFYLNALNLAYSHIFMDKIGKDKINNDDLIAESKSFKGIKKFFKDNGLNKPDKVLIAKQIFEIAINKSGTPNDDTIKIFSKLFRKINNIYN